MQAKNGILLASYPLVHSIEKRAEALCKKLTLKMEWHGAKYGWAMGIGYFPFLMPLLIC